MKIIEQKTIISITCKYIVFVHMFRIINVIMQNYFHNLKKNNLYNYKNIANCIVLFVIYMFIIKKKHMFLYVCETFIKFANNSINSMLLSNNLSKSIFISQKMCKIWISIRLLNYLILCIKTLKNEINFI